MTGREWLTGNSMRSNSTRPHEQGNERNTTHDAHDIHAEFVRTPPHLVQSLLQLGIHIRHMFVRIIEPTLGIVQHDILSSHLLSLPQCQFAQVLYPLADFIELGVEFGIAVAYLCELDQLGAGEGGATARTGCP